MNKGYLNILLFLYFFIYVEGVLADVNKNEFSTEVNTVLLSPGSATNVAVTDSDSLLNKNEKIPFRSNTDVGGSYIFKVVVAFILTVVLAVAAIYMLRKYNFVNVLPVEGKNKRINVLEIKRVTPKLFLVLVEIESEKILFAQCGDNVVFYQNYLKGEGHDGIRHSQEQV